MSISLEQARDTLANLDDEDDVAGLPASILGKLSIDDMAEGAGVQVGTYKNRILHLEWNGKLQREGDALFGVIDHTWTRKYWYDPIGLEQYLDLVRRAVEVRARTRGDVALTHSDDDGQFPYTFLTGFRAWR